MQEEQNKMTTMTDERRRQMWEEVSRGIEQNGRFIIQVFPRAESGSKYDPINDSFAYTIGNWTPRGLPELLLVGVSLGGHLAGVLNDLSEKMIARECAFADGELVNLGGKCPVCIIEASDSVKEKYTIQATTYQFGLNYRVMQVVAPDRNGRFPWEEGCQEPYKSVIVHRRQANEPEWNGWTNGLIFQFKEMDRAKAFAAAVKDRFGLGGRVFDDAGAAERSHMYPFRQFPPVVHIDRPFYKFDKHTPDKTWEAGWKTERQVEKMAKKFGGTFVGT
jgi:Domain of unknown function (DUF4262)